jgi:hypothetical protein
MKMGVAGIGRRREAGFPRIGIRRHAVGHQLLPLNVQQNHFKQSLSRQATSETNPKSEYRNPKQTQRQTNLKAGKSKTPNPKEACLELYVFWSFEILSNFGFRASNLLFLEIPSTLLRTCFASSRESSFSQFRNAKNSTENFKYFRLVYLLNCLSGL